MADPTYTLTGAQLSGLGASPEQIQALNSPNFLGGGSGPGLFGQGASNPIGGPAAANTGLGASLGPNIGTGQLAVGGLSALGNLWTAWNATNLAKQSFNFNKTLATDNYTNSADAYNSAVADKANTRAVMENQTPGQAQSYIAANSVKNTI